MQDHKQSGRRQQNPRRCGIAVRITGSNRQTAEPGADGIAKVEGHLRAGSPQQFAAFGIVNDQHLLGTGNAEQTAGGNKHQHRRSRRHRRGKNDQQKADRCLLYTSDAADE